ncbi:MAG: ABC transporter ATP-binding protein [Candidatus Pacearchaeota archaeon]
MKEVLIEIENLFFSYDHQLILKGINFQLYKGEKVGLMGKTGAGKTTLFYLLMGFLKPLSGNIKIFGKIRNKEKDFVEIRTQLGLLFQDPEIQLFCPTIKEDIAFGPLNQGKSREEVKEIVDEITKLLEIKHLLNRSVLKLSGGEKKICALASVMAMQPKIYLLDEPTNGLDEHYQNKIVNLLKEKMESFILVSHDQDLLTEVCEKIYLLERGTLKIIKSR